MKQETANETKTDIISEMRGNEFDDPHLDAEGIIGARILARGWADRLEAAWKREHSNAAAMRKYAKRLVDAVKEADLCDFNYGAEFCKSCKYNPMCKAARDCESAIAFSEGELTVHNAAEMREVVMMMAYVILPEKADGEDQTWIGWLRAIQIRAKETLSAPPRNCDTLETYNDFVDAWNDYIRGGKPDGPIRDVSGFLFWLSQKKEEDK